MKCIKNGLLLFFIMVLLGGCSIYVRPVVPDDHGSIVDLIKKDPSAQEPSTAKPEEIKPIESQPVLEKPLETKPEEPKKEDPPPTVTPVQVLKVRITPENPAKDGSVLLSVEGPANTPYTAVFHFRTRDSVIQGYCGVPFQVALGGATIGFEVKVEVTALVEGQVQKAAASFTPK